eukprot:3018649-Prymnesium_polylepis.1
MPLSSLQATMPGRTAPHRHRCFRHRRRRHCRRASVCRAGRPTTQPRVSRRSTAARGPPAMLTSMRGAWSVSYTHLKLPTICSV